MDLSVNKPAKSFIKNHFAKWYSELLLQQLQAQDDVPLQEVILKPIDLCLPVLKNVSASWFVQMAEYISNNSQFVVKGFAKAGISGALDGVTLDEDCLLQDMDTQNHLMMNNLLRCTQYVTNLSV